MEGTVEAISPPELNRLIQYPSTAGEYSALTGHPLLLLDLLNNKNTAAAGQYRSLKDVLPRISCPVIAVAPPDIQTSLADSVDVVVSSHKEARTLVANILQHPMAAMTLVQLLRHNEKSSLEDGLLAESLAYATLQGGSEFRHYLATRHQPPQPPENPDPPVLVEREEDRLILTLNRPEQHNAYSIAMRDALFEGFQLQAADSSITKTIVRGAGTCFCTGGALEEFGLAEDLAEAHAIRSTRHVGRLIAAISGKVECYLHKACIGSGIELPAFADRVVAQRNTFFHLPEITMGLIPGAGGTVSILRRIGRQRMAYLALSAKRINATTALEWGLIDEIVA
jgi:enoyl-CoA hydratase/carnithine racemase